MHLRWILSLLAMAMVQAKSESVVLKFKKILCDPISIPFAGTITQAKTPLIGCASLCSVSSSFNAFMFSAGLCTIFSDSGLVCPPEAIAANSTEVYVLANRLSYLQVTECPVDHPFVTNNGSTCCANYTKISNAGLNAACNGNPVTPGDPAICCGKTVPCTGAPCTHNPRFSSGCLLTGADNPNSYLHYYSSITNESVCQQKCQQYAGCAWFTYNSGPGSWSLYCYLKVAGAVKRAGSPFIGGPAHCYGYGCLMVNTGYATYSSMGSPTTAINEYYCQMSCQATASCINFSFVTSNSTCILMNNVGTISDAQGLITGPAYCY